jgi:hypothetical protein
MKKLYAVDNLRDFKRIGSAVIEVEKINGGGKPLSQRVMQTAIYAKITSLINTATEADEGKEAKGVEVVFNGSGYSFGEVSEDPLLYDADMLDSKDATVFTRNNISSKTAMAVDDIVKISHYPNLSETSDWLVEETGGAGNTALCTVLSERADPNEFNVSVKVGNPNAAATGTLPTGILYLNYATTNALAVGGNILAVTYPTISGVSGVTFDCFAIETIYNLVAPPEPEP